MTSETADGTIQHSPDYFNFPGQGSQSVGMSNALYENLKKAREMYDQTDAILNYPLRELSNNENMLARTRYTQPTIVSNSLIRLALMRDLGLVNGVNPVEMVAGHSVGLYSGLVESGAVTYEDGMKLVDARAIGMQHASDIFPGGMASVLGVTEEQAEEVCDETENLHISVLNEPGSVVVGGTYKALAEGEEKFKKMGRVKVRRLDVDGPFHTPLMDPAAQILENQIALTQINAPKKQLIANTSANLLVTPDDIRNELKAQLVSPVRWQDVTDRLHDLGYTHGIESSDAKILSNIRKRRHGGHIRELVAAGAALGGTAIALGVAYILHEHEEKKEE